MMNCGGNIFLLTSRLGFGHRLIHARADELHARHVVGRIRRLHQRMTQRERLDQPDVGAVELFQRKVVVEERLAGRDLLELPLHELGGHALRFVHLVAIEFRQVGETAFGALDAIEGIRARARRELLFELALFLAGKIARTGGKVGIGAHPFIGEAGEERIDGGATGLIGLRQREARRQQCVCKYEQQSVFLHFFPFRRSYCRRGLPQC